MIPIPHILVQSPNGGFNVIPKPSSSPSDQSRLYRWKRRAAIIYESTDDQTQHNQAHKLILAHIWLINIFLITHYL